MLYNVHRPKRFTDVVGQESELNVIKTMLEKNWRPSAILLAGGYGCGKCVTGDTLIHTKQGLVRIGSLHQSELPDGAREMDLEVLSPSGWVRSSHFYYGGVKPTLRVLLASGQEVKGTLVHPIQVISEHGVRWVQLQDLEEGDFVVTKPTPFEGTGDLNPEAYFMGFSVGDGSYNGRRLMLSGSKGSLETLLKLKSFGDEVWHKDNRRDDLFSVHTVAGREFLKSKGFEDAVSYTKKLPEWLITASQDEQLSVLRGLLDTDGCVATAEFNTVSEELARQVQTLLQSIGLLSRVHVKKGTYRGAGHLSWRVLIDRPQLRNFKHNLGVLKDWSSWKEVEPSLGTRSGSMPRPAWLRSWAKEVPRAGLSLRVLQTLKNCAAPGSSGINRETLVWLQRNLGDVSDPRLDFFLECGASEVVSVRDNGLDEVFDLTVPEGSSFVANGIVVHNTTLARLIARALLCDNRQGVEPCGVCDSCKAMDHDSNTAYLEIDSASNGLVADIRTLKDEASYRAVGGKQRIVVLDESHMISVQGQNAMLQLLEEGKDGVLFIFATTEAEKMLPTIRSRCVELNLKLLTAGEIYKRLVKVVEHEGVEYDDKALKVISTYVRGHMRDALVLLEQLIRMSPKVSEDLVRTHLRLDKLVELYEFLTEKEKAKLLVRLENLLCHQSPGDLAESLGQVLIDAYKMHLGLGDYSQVDQAWMKKVMDAQGVDKLLPRAEKVLSLNTDFASIQYGLAAIMQIFDQENAAPAAASPRSLIPGSGTAQAFRKPTVNKGD